MNERVISLLQREADNKRELLLNGTIQNFEQYRTALAEYKTYLAAVEIVMNAEITDEDDIDDDSNMTEIGS